MLWFFSLPRSWNLAVTVGLNEGIKKCIINKSWNLTVTEGIKKSNSNWRDKEMYNKCIINKCIINTNINKCIINKGDLKGGTGKLTFVTWKSSVSIFLKNEHN